VAVVELKDGSGPAVFEFDALLRRQRGLAQD
jgi:hypothetical protein